MNKRTDNERLLEEVLAAEADGGFREASLENILRLARHRRRHRIVRRVVGSAVILLVTAIVALRSYHPRQTRPEVAQTNPSMRIAIEYKFKEPRTHISFCNAAKTLLMIQEMGVDNVGIVYDLGHSLFAKETPGEALQMINRYGKLYGVEMNDNWREWDDDLAVGSIHVIETLEFLYALRQIKWKGPILLDQFPFREDTVTAAHASIRSVRALDRLLDRIDVKALRVAHKNQDALAAQQLVQSVLLGNSE